MKIDVKVKRDPARANRGATGELRVAADLIDAGYYVFRAVGHFGPFDLVAYRDEVLLRVEVRITKRRSDGTLRARMNFTDECDIYALVDHQGSIEYQGSEQMKTIWADHQLPKSYEYEEEEWASCG